VRAATSAVPARRARSSESLRGGTGPDPGSSRVKGKPALGPGPHPAASTETLLVAICPEHDQRRAATDEWPVVDHHVRLRTDAEPREQRGELAPRGEGMPAGPAVPGQVAIEVDECRAGDMTFVVPVSRRGPLACHRKSEDAGVGCDCSHLDLPGGSATCAHLAPPGVAKRYHRERDRLLVRLAWGRIGRQMPEVERLLVVDDEAPILHALQRTFEAAGYRGDRLRRSVGGARSPAGEAVPVLSPTT